MKSLHAGFSLNRGHMYRKPRQWALESDEAGFRFRQRHLSEHFHWGRHLPAEWRLDAVMIQMAYGEWRAQEGAQKS